MQMFLETHIYMKRILQFFFPNLNNVYFKMLPSNRTVSRGDSELLQLLAQMTQFSKGYNISYFLLPAFAPEGSRHHSCWEISNYSNLADVLAYRDIQSRQLKLESRRPVLIKWRNHTVNQDPGTEKVVVKQGIEMPAYWLFIGFAALSLLIALLIKAMCMAKRNANLLTDEEVEEFLKERKEGLDVASDNNDYNGKLVAGEYQNQFEICKSKIKLDLDQVLGMGNFGIVYKATVDSVDGSVAAKMPKEGCDKSTFIGMLREVKLLGYLGTHVNVVGFLGCYTQEIQHEILHIVMEFCSGVSLLSHLQRFKLEKDKLDENAIILDLLGFCRDIARGMEYIASRKVVHGDLSARNVLLDEFKTCKITDFGLSRKLYTYTYSKETYEPLPWRWMAYESLASMKFSTMSDVWSFGVTLWEIFNLGDIPYPGLDWTCDFVNELKDGMRLSIPPLATSEIYEKMVTCWRLEPTERPNFKELFNFVVALLPYYEMNTG